MASLFAEEVTRVFVTGLEAAGNEFTGLGTSAAPIQPDPGSIPNAKN